MQSKLYTLLALTISASSLWGQGMPKAQGSFDPGGGSMVAPSHESMVGKDHSEAALIDYTVEKGENSEIYTVNGFGKYPIIPFGIMDKKKHPVVGAYKYLPILEIEGEKERGSSKTNYMFERAARYSEGFIKVEDMESLSLNQDFGQDKTRVTGKAISNRDLNDVYFAIVVYDNKLNYGVNFGEIGDLKKGEPLSFRLEVPNVRTTYGERDWRDNIQKFMTEGGEVESNEARLFAIFFHNGLEVPSVFSPKTTNFFNQQRFMQYTEKLEEHLEKLEGKDANLQVVDMQSQPFFGDIDAENKPSRLDAKITFEPSGLVGTVELTGDLDCDSAYKEELVRAIRNWFVFPKVVNGEAVETTVKVPFEIGG